MELDIQTKTFAGVELQVTTVEGIGYFNQAQLLDIGDRIMTEQAKTTFVDIAEAQKYLDDRPDVFAEMRKWSPEPGIAATVKAD
ncbi:hypothetical protein MGA5115_00986 [Marinomonas gallaica]|uniref:Uncharacterized protein n=1 Tax=Marinomonas gallaica TaxID=1806667 RepID=A0A1C3JP99_9GAMM|nr:hypothetical protein [Marinomonas gallaica]SBT16900.1 hypothetical protein MGA5115_00986 [Marinomonas gallaica]SBT22149.1 hypothetical protein MGA5116_02762 [Marinomonas gallaica]